MAQVVSLNNQNQLVFPPGRIYAAQRQFFEHRLLHNPYWQTQRNVTKSKCLFFAKVPDQQINHVIEAVLEFEKRSGKLILFNKYPPLSFIGQVFEIRLERTQEFLELWSRQPMSFIRRRLKPRDMDYFASRFLKWIQHPKNIWSSCAYGLHALLLCHIIVHIEQYHSPFREQYPLCLWVEQLHTETSMRFWFGYSKKLQPSSPPTQVQQQKINKEF